MEKHENGRTKTDHKIQHMYHEDMESNTEQIKILAFLANKPGKQSWIIDSESSTHCEWQSGV